MMRKKIETFDQGWYKNSKKEIPKDGIFVRDMKIKAGKLNIFTKESLLF